MNKQSIVTVSVGKEAPSCTPGVSPIRPKRSRYIASRPGSSFQRIVGGNKPNAPENVTAMNYKNILEPTTACHIVAMPYPGRGHINPMLNLCKIIASKSDNIFITFVVTEEWFGFIGSDPIPDRIRFCSMPNVLPSELVRAANLFGFLQAVWTKMESPFETLLDQLNPPPTLIIADFFLFWAVSVGNRRNIPVASLCTLSAFSYSLLHHFHLFRENGHFPFNLSDELVSYIPGISPTQLVDLIAASFGSTPYILEQMLKSISLATEGKAKYLLLASVHELETKTIDALRAELPFPVYPIGPAIPYLKLRNNSTSSSVGDNEPNYFHWLDRQPKNSVLYVSMGSFLSVSNTQVDEIAAGLNQSGVRFLWVSREEKACNDLGLVVAWCDQLRVLCHPSIGGFWSHCGWNSAQEGIFAGLPFLTFPLAAEQRTNTKLIVDDWKIGWRVKKQFLSENLVERGEISMLVAKFMDPKCAQVKEMRERAKELKEKFHKAIDRNGSSDMSVNSLIKNIISQTSD